jgi:DNA invertase Pin-like site-specific DNA recombinase
MAESMIEVKKVPVIALYTRSSVLDTNPAYQVLACKDYMIRRGVFEEADGIVRVKKDETGQELATIKYYKENASGATRSARPELAELLSEVDKGSLSEVVVFNFSRMFRNTGQMCQILEKFKSKGIKFTSISEGIDTSSLMGECIVKILSAMAEMQRESIRENVKLGMARAKASGRNIGRPKGSRDKRRRARARVLAGHRGWDKRRVKEEAKGLPSDFNEFSAKSPHEVK